MSTKAGRPHREKPGTAKVAVELDRSLFSEAREPEHDPEKVGSGFPRDKRGDHAQAKRIE
jgi:hypothetical protein